MVAFVRKNQSESNFIYTLSGMFLFPRFAIFSEINLY